MSGLDYLEALSQDQLVSIKACPHYMFKLVSYEFGTSSMCLTPKPVSGETTLLPGHKLPQIKNALWNWFILVLVCCVDRP